MSTFFVLPPRAHLGRQVAELLANLFPGLAWDGLEPDLAEMLATAATARPDVYVIFRDELPEGIATTEALVSSCGAEDGDEVVEVATGAALNGAQARRWHLGQPATRAA